MAIATRADHISSGFDFTTKFKLRENAYAQIQAKLQSASIDTRAALADFVSSGDEFQQRVVNAIEKTIRLVAPAGSGKTQTLVHRILKRVQDGVRPDRILALTFDNAAAHSLKEKYESELARIGAQDQARGTHISTLNAFGYSMILREYFPAEHKPIIENDRRRGLFRHVRRELREKSPDHAAVLPSNVRDNVFLDLFSRLKNELFDPRAFDAQRFADLIQDDEALQRVLVENAADDRGMYLVIQAIDWLFRRYEERLREDNLMDLDDQKLRAYHCLHENAGVLGVVQRRYDEVIVDEFQDINQLDFEFIKAIAKAATLMITGDDDQAIYGFRLCSPKYIIELEKHLERPVTSYELQRNYRCPPNLVTQATKLINRNTWRIAKNPIAHLTEASQIRVVDSLGAGLEARWIVDLIKQARVKNPKLGYQNFAVLYRTNAQSLPPQVEFILNGIPYHVRDEDNILSNEVLERLLSVLRVKVALASHTAPATRDCIRALRAYYRTVSSSIVSRLDFYFGTRDRRDFLDMLETPELAEILGPKWNVQLAHVFRQVFEEPKLLATLELLAAKFKGLKAMIGSLDEVAEEKVPLGEIYEIAANFDGDIPSFLETIEHAMTKAKQTHAGKDEEHGVALRTYFRAKGRQWHTVILIGCNEGLIPHKRASSDPMKLEEERRLFYVGMTRASANLVISHLKNVCKGSVAPSRFIEEAGLARV